MIYPKFLKIGDCIGVPAPSDGAYDEIDCMKYNNAKRKLEELGYKVDFSKSAFNSYKARSADAETRGKEITEMFENKDVNMIICAAGGEFCVECLSYIDFDKIAKNPKWFQGFSDPTCILFPITTKYDIATIYGHNIGAFAMEPYHLSIANNLEILKGNIIPQNSFDLYELEKNDNLVTGTEGYNLTQKVEWKMLNGNSCNISGRMIGGCFDLIAQLSGTKYDGSKAFCEKYKEDGIIWYFDNFELSNEEMIRVLWKMNELEYFKYAKGVIFGRVAYERTCMEYTVEEALKDSVLGKMNIPVIFDACITHKKPTLTIINGAMYNIDFKNGSANLRFELK